MIDITYNESITLKDIADMLIKEKDSDLSVVVHGFPDDEIADIQIRFNPKISLTDFDE
ncbi:MAG: hypothetical protein K5744_02025 [Eubacterium sp.]|nr:hypothetical protein [Eubacterium sp.]